MREVTKGYGTVLMLLQESMPGQSHARAFINEKEVSLNEYDHALRAMRLRGAFSKPDVLAEFLHQQYRAAAKSFHVGTGCPFRHDHGFNECTVKGKKYFRRRAGWLFTFRPSSNGKQVNAL